MSAHFPDDETVRSGECIAEQTPGRSGTQVAERYPRLC